MAADTDEVVDASFGEPAPAVRALRAVAAVGSPAVSANSPGPIAGGRPTRCRVRARRSRYEHLLLALSDSDVVKTILGQSRSRSMTSSDRSNPKPSAARAVRGRSRRVAPGQGRAQPRFVASNELGHSYVGPEHFLIGPLRKAKVWRPTCCAVTASRRSAAPAGKQGGRQRGRGWPRRTPTNTPELDKYSRDLTKMAPRANSIQSSAVRRRSRPPSRAGPAQEKQPGVDR